MLSRLRQLSKKLLAASMLLGGLAGSLPASAECAAGACIYGNSGVIAFNPANSALLGPILSALLPGNAIDIGVVDHEAIASADVNLGVLLEILAADLSLASPDEVLTADVSLLQFFSAAAQAVEADGNLVALQALEASILSIPGIENLTIPIGDLLVVDFPQGSLVDVDVNLLSLITSSVQLFNHTNALTFPNPITLGDQAALEALGLNGIAEQVDLLVQVVEPPNYGCSRVGTVFRSPAMRVKLNIDLIDAGVSNTPIIAALTALTAPLTGVSIDADVEAGDLELYLEIGSSQATLSSVNLSGPQAVIDVVPGVVNAYIGHITDEVFFDESYMIDIENDLQYSQIAGIDATISTPQGLLADMGLAVEFRAHTQGDYDGETLVFNGPFPETQETSGGTSGVADILGALLSNLDSRVTLDQGDPNATINPLLAALGIGLDEVLNVVETASDLIVDDIVLDLLDQGILETTIDVILDILGIGIGSAEFTVLDVARICSVEGCVYEDENTNSNLNFGEDYPDFPDGTQLYAKLVETIPGGGDPVVKVVPVDLADGCFAFIEVSEGSHQMILSDNDDAADLTPAVPAGWVGTEAPDQQRTVFVPQRGNPSRQDFGVFHGARIEGVVFQDIGNDDGTANNGQQDGGETGIANTNLVVTTGAGAILTAARTSNNGEFVLYVRNGVNTAVIKEFNRTEFVSTGGDAGDTGGTYSLVNDSIQFSVESGTVYRNIQFGDVPRNLFSPDNRSVTTPGGSAVYAHQFVAGTDGQVNFSAQDSSSHDQFGWQTSLYADANCNGVIDAGEPFLNQAVTVTAGQAICLLNKVDAPADAIVNSSHGVDIFAEFVCTGQPANTEPATGGASESPSYCGGYRQSVNDITTVSDSSAEITLLKTADKQQANPGDTITFSLSYANNGESPINQVLISDYLPAYTSAISADCVNPLGDGLSSCQALINGAEVLWSFEGQLQPGGSGSVSFTVLVDD